MVCIEYQPLFFTINKGNHSEVDDCHTAGKQNRIGRTRESGDKGGTESYKFQFSGYMFQPSPDEAGAAWYRLPVAGKTAVSYELYAKKATWKLVPGNLKPVTVLRFYNVSLLK
jgi:hypothetical protein